MTDQLTHPAVPETDAPTAPHDLSTPGTPVAVVWTALGSAPIPDARPEAAEPIYTRTDAALYGPCGVPDGAGTLFEGSYSIQGNETIFHLFRTPRTGVPSGPYDFPPPAGPNPLKYDGFSLTVAKSSTGLPALITHCTVHEAISTSGRKSIFYRGVITDPALGIVAYADGHAPMGAAVADSVFGGAPAPDPGAGGEVDLTEGAINAVARKVLDLYKAELASNAAADLQKVLQKIVKNGAGDAITAHPITLPPGLLTTANMGQAYAASQEVMQQLDNRAGLQMWKVLIASGVVAPAKAPQWVKDQPGFPWPNG